MSNEKLKNLTSKIGSGSTPRGGKSSYLEQGPYKLIRSQNIYNHYYTSDGLAYITNEQAEKLKNVSLEKRDILINITGDSVARTTIVENDMLPGRVNQHVSIIRCKENLLDPYYLLAFLTSKMTQSYLLSLAQVGGTRAALTKGMLEQLDIPLLNYEKQKKIGKMLKIINEKINLNNSIILSLEQLSQTLFKQWFIDFEFPNEEGKPYKSSGGEMLESELGNIPKNWTLSYFSNYVKHTVGGDWGKENVEKNYVEQVSIIRGADIPELIKGTDNKVPTRFILKKNYENKKLLSGDIVIEISGGSPTQSTGRSIFINKNIISRYNDKVLCTNFCRIIRPVDFNKGIWLQIYINYLYKKNVFFNFENGTTGIKNLDLNAVLNKYKIFSPSEDIIHLFSERMKVILDSIQNLGMENKRLANLRDTLLPKLLSGEIEIPDELEV
ncbi:restriction endonuclease subunit S [Brochothrix thermosphacta]|uniref:restriction endonuclease subunit S n=1 Tax=Brochothrix thermosphacta TaxID=2756 RepID=UPI0039B0D07D